jgi:hypothetical protein
MKKIIALLLSFYSLNTIAFSQSPTKTIDIEVFLPAYGVQYLSSEVKVFSDETEEEQNLTMKSTENRRYILSLPAHLCNSVKLIFSSSHLSGRFPGHTVSYDIKLDKSDLCFAQEITIFGTSHPRVSAFVKNGEEARDRRDLLRESLLEQQVLIDAEKAALAAAIGNDLIGFLHGKLGMRINSDGSVIINKRVLKQLPPRGATVTAPAVGGTPGR